MPTTRSAGIHPQQITFLCPEGPHQGNVGESQKTKTILNRVVASQEQLVILRGLHQRSLLRALTREDVEKAALYSGLYEVLHYFFSRFYSNRGTRGTKWIRKWLTRQNGSRKKGKVQLSGYIEREISVGEVQTPSEVDHTIEPSMSDYSMNISTPPYSILDLLTDAPLESVPATRPDICRSHSAPELPTRSTILHAPLGACGLGHGNVVGRSLTNSPSLGYIPLVFPGPSALPQSNSSTSSHGSSVESEASFSPATPQSLESQQPCIPNLNLPLDWVHDYGHSNDNESAVLSLLQLLQDVTSNGLVQPQTTVSSAPASQNASQSICFGNHVSGVLSFAPSLQSHSTSVMINSTTEASAKPNYSYPIQPVPVSYKARVPRLSALAKRICATSADDLNVGSSDTSRTGNVPYFVVRFSANSRTVGTSSALVSSAATHSSTIDSEGDEVLNQASV